MEDAALVRVEDRARDRREDLDEPEERELGRSLPGAGLLDDAVERAAAHELHGEEELLPRRHAHLVDGHDPRVLELGRRLRLVHEACRERVVRDLVEHDLHGDAASQVAVERPVDDAHAAAPELVLDRVASLEASRPGRDRGRAVLAGELDAHGDRQRGRIRRQGRLGARGVLDQARGWSSQGRAVSMGSGLGRPRVKARALRLRA